MANKRRQPVSVTGTEKLIVTSPARRSNRRRAAVESAQRGGSPCSENRAEERSLYKTPKRTQVSRSRLPTFSSPTNEIDNQQEIFWDPQSPTIYKLGNSQKKLTIGGHTVEISEIVNRIAPQDEKPACYEGSFLGLWIGEDAIPCTPGVTKARSRTKINTAGCSRDHQLKHGEELMKLAKQFDKNLIDAVQEQNFLQPNSIHVSSTAKPSTDHHIQVQREDQWQLLNEHPALNSTSSHGRLKENAGTVKSPKSSSQKSIDLDAEGALNELFDCSTQKCSGRLSQGVLNCSLIPVVQDKGTLLEAEQPSVSDEPQGQSAMHLKQHSKFLLTEKARTTSVQTFSGAELSNNNPDNTFSDDNYDWDADLLPDDSLLMQIVQEPELMKSAEDAIKSTEDARISEENGESKKWTINPKKPSIAQAGVYNASNTIPVSCVSMSNQNIRTEKAKIIPFHGDSSLKTNKVDSFSKIRQNNTLVYNFTSVKSENRNVPHGPSHLKSGTNTSSEKRTSISFSDLATLSTGKFKSHVHGTSYKASVVSANKNYHDLKTAANRGNSDCPSQTSVAKKGMFSFDDWGDPKFSDEVLELFCESNTSWGTHCDDDDDLLYQVCDDVERKTQSQMGMKETGKAKSMAKSTSNLVQSLCQPGQRLPICLQTEKNRAGRKTFSLDLPIAVRKNENSANTVFEGSFASGTGIATMSGVQININNRQWQNGHDVGKIKTNCNQLSSEKSKYMFKKTSSSQALILDHKNVNVGSLSGTNKGLWESKNAPNIPFQKVMNGKPVVKSIDFAPSEKEYKSRRCSQEEIARKKQEALERRKCKMETLFKTAAPT
ncbi:ewing's tumor-associated antigen 1 [Pituophis catenifer annectens]|uniref:ewing's tumor-associated antigen 1 n=1 Tax=Pituophis catenifer annectens TaxID=94852 RepID=UPI003996ACED